MDISNNYQNEELIKRTIEKELDELIDRVNYGGVSNEVERKIWHNDVQTLCFRYLDHHPLSVNLYNSLHDGYDDSAIQNTLACLISVRKDKHFFQDIQKKETKRRLKSEYDVFISHANKDIDDLVEQLYDSLRVLGINIFYDKDTLEWGDNWKKRILDGTQKAEFAIIVISENFFDREWTEKELAKFLRRQNRQGQKLILPILHNITIEQLIDKYPSIADLQCISSSSYSCDQIALLFAKQLIKRLNA